MHQLVLKTNYPTLLWHFVDSLSMWDFFVEDETEEYFKAHWQLTTSDKMHLANYAKSRAQLNWKNETNLFEWAWQGFPQNKRFSILLPHVRYFEQRKTNDGQTLKQILQISLQDVHNAKVHIEKRIRQENVITIVHQLQTLFHSPSEVPDRINAYLASTPSEKGWQGGANGEGIYTEVPAKGYDLAYETLVHEYLHRAVQVRNYFKAINDPKLSMFYRTIIKSIYPDNLACLADEVVIHAVADVYLFHQKPQKRIQKAQEHVDKGREKSVSELHLWSLVALTSPIIKQYLSEKTTEDKARNQFNHTFQEYIREVSS